MSLLPVLIFERFSHYQIIVALKMVLFHAQLTESHSIRLSIAFSAFGLAGDAGSFDESK